MVGIYNVFELSEVLVSFATGIFDVRRSMSESTEQTTLSLSLSLTNTDRTSMGLESFGFDVVKSNFTHIILEKWLIWQIRREAKKISVKVDKPK